RRSPRRVLEGPGELLAAHRRHPVRVNKARADGVDPDRVLAPHSGPRSGQRQDPGLGCPVGVRVRRRQEGRLGARLARLETKTAIEQLLRVAPEYRLRDIDFGNSMFIRGPERGTVEVGARIWA